MSLSHVVGLPRGADGFYVLEMLGLDGWAILVTTAGPDTMRVRATRGEHVVEHEGASVAEIALQVYEEARESPAGSPWTLISWERWD